MESSHWQVRNFCSGEIGSEVFYRSFFHTNSWRRLVFFPINETLPPPPLQLPNGKYVVCHLKNLITWRICYFLHILSNIQNVRAAGFGKLIKQKNFYRPFLSVITVRRHDYHNGVMSYMLQIRGSTIHMKFVA